MAFEAQIDKLVEKLTELTRAGKVAWQDTADEDSFLTSVGQSVVIVGRERSDYAAPCFVRILNARGTIIKEAGATEPNTLRAIAFPGRKYSASEDREDWERLRTLHELARENALKSEKAVSDLLSSLEAIR